MHERLNKAKDEGFTLIELLIVVIILGILAAIVVFAVGSTRKDSTQATCQTDIKSIALAEEAYNTKNGGYTGTQGSLDTLKSWPGGTAATDNLFFTLGSTGATNYSITIQGKNYTGSHSVSVADTSDNTVATQCTPNS